MECGQLGQIACQKNSIEWKLSGDRFCDRGLKVYEENDIKYCINDKRKQIKKDLWIKEALQFQRKIASHLPLNNLSFPATHNSYNSRADQNIFANQRYSLTDQLNMGIRSFEFDVHWKSNTLRVCHAFNDSFGCNNKSRPFFAIIEELKIWIQKPINRDEIIIIYLEEYTKGYEKNTSIHPYFIT